MTLINPLINPLINRELNLKNLIQKIDAILPQTQCTKCGYPDCMAYATAIAEGMPHNQCPPGKDEGIAKLSALLNRPILPLNPAHGAAQKKVRAFIREDECIGCTKCIQACPVDAIIGTAKKMHTVIESECTGCDLCVSPCPVDCIDLVELSQEKQPEFLTHSERETLQDYSRMRHQNRTSRLAQREAERLQRHATLRDSDKKKNYLQAALSFSSQNHDAQSSDLDSHKKIK
jgi:electron transport complex protein RnfB